MRLSPRFGNGSSSVVVSTTASTTFLVLFLSFFLGWTTTTVTLANPEEDLPWGDINVMVLTDVHSWIGGHLHESDRNADYGDVLSFYERLKKYAKKQGRDLWFVMNGDWIHGTGLAST
jgi:2',3'-cyclic-nucleotide 2'-phosphodiesterase (5'-nucleotidase family)